MSEIVIPTRHAIQRVRERAGVTRVKAFLDYLWANGDPLGENELRYHHDRYNPDNDYRRAYWRGCEFIVVRCENRYVTLIKVD